jgi:hypothetical protein|tara:strand:- start:52 stop:333 length:282 start_codon:yes stop_codon:yes gene_type:complete
MATKSELEIEKWRKEAREFKKIIKELTKDIAEKELFIQFLQGRVEDKNEQLFHYRTGHLNMSVDDFIKDKNMLADKKSKMIQKEREDKKDGVV